MGRHKALIGPRLRARGFAAQETETVIGVVMLLAGENSRDVVSRVKEKVAEIEKNLPEGVAVEAFYDRTALVERTIHTLTKNLIEGGVLVVIVLLVLLGSVRAGLVVALAVPLAMLGAFVGMLYAGLSGNRTNASAAAMSSLSRPARSGPNSTPACSSRAQIACSSAAAPMSGTRCGRAGCWVNSSRRLKGRGLPCRIR